MKITSEWLKEKGACNEGYNWFLEKFKEGGEYQEVLNVLATEDDKASWAQWLIQTAGPTKDVIKVKGDWKVKNWFVTGSLEVEGYLSAEFCVIAGKGIKAGKGILLGGLIVIIYALLRSASKTSRTEEMLYAEEKFKELVKEDAKELKDRNV